MGERISKTMNKDQVQLSVDGCEDEGAVGGEDGERCSVGRQGGRTVIAARSGAWPAVLVVSSMGCITAHPRGGRLLLEASEDVVPGVVLELVRGRPRY